MSELVSLSRDAEIGVITINNPPVNALSLRVAEEILSCVKFGRSDDSVKALVLIGAGRTFIAGADIKEFEAITSGQRARDVGFTPLLAALEDCPKPVICAIHGTALGGGLEVAMACHYRVAVASAQMGQPEVKLGLIPGAGGTQRLPRLAGIAKAVEMCTGGNPIKAAEALANGIIDRVIAGDLLEGALEYARELLIPGVPPRRTRDMSEKLGDPEANVLIFESARERVRQRERGRMAPLKTVDAIEAAAKMSFDDGLRKEADLFMECLFSDQSKALIHVFFGEREVSKVPGITKDIPVKEVRKAAVVGAGTMGSGIAMNYANAGIPVLLKEVSQEALDRAMANVRKDYESSARKGRLTPEAVSERLKLIQPVLSYDRFPEVDIVVEAVFEEMELKQEVFAELDEACKADAILATNTSSLDIDRIASVTAHPRRVIGHHFFAPPSVMRLVEIVRGKATSREVIASSMALARKLNKVGVLVGNCFGFAGNRMYLPYQREAQFLVEEGAQVQDVDAALFNFGMAMGPLATADLTGLDVAGRIQQEQSPLGPRGARRPLIASKLCEGGRLGQKTGSGWYRYQARDRKPIPDPAVTEIAEGQARAAGIARRLIPNEEIVERTIYALINEGAKILEERIALRAVDIDIIYIYGYGFPAHRGGPMWFADTVGLDRVYRRVCEFEQQHGVLWAPAPLLKRLAESGRSFADFDREPSAA